MNQPLFVPVNIVQRLGVALEFYDIFTGLPVTSALEVAVPKLRWCAFRAESDATYRFLTSNRPVPAGSFDVSVTSLDQSYVARAPVSITLPRVIGHAPPVIRSDYLARFPLWPTRLRPIPPGETAIIGRVESVGANPIARLRIFIYAPPGPPPAEPYAYTDETGEFVYRLPGLRMTIAGTLAVKTAVLTAAVRDAAGAAIATQANIVVDLGKSQFLKLAIP